MADFDLKELVKYIVWTASQQGYKLTQTRIIKFLYLADLYQARKNGGKTLSGWPWAFVYFGPYCSEAFETLNRAEEEHIINKLTLESKFSGREEYHLYECADEDEPKASSNIPFGVRMRLQRDIKEWGNDTQSLLDHVYFDTEPMRDALPKERLDFSKAVVLESQPQIKMRKLSKDTLAKGTNLLEKLKEKHIKSQDKRIEREKKRISENLYDEHYEQALNILDHCVLCNEYNGIAKIETKKND